MKTEFKVGQKVWDAVNFPNEDGTVNNFVENTFIAVHFQSGRKHYYLDGRMEYHSIQTLKPYQYTVEFKEKKLEPVVGQYYYFWDNGKDGAVYHRFKQMQGSSFLPDDVSFGFDNISETPPFK